MNTILEVNNLSKNFYFYKNIFSTHKVEAVKSVSFKLKLGQTIAIIGENGSGKSTIVGMLLGIIKPTNGEILVNGHHLKFGDHSYRSKYIRMIFKDPNTSLNPYQRVGHILEIPLKLNTNLTKIDRKKRIVQILKKVGLFAIHAEYYPCMLKYWQKHRILLARALVLYPNIIIADESFVLLDVSMRSQIINLMLELQIKYNISYIYVTHNLGIIKHISDKILVMNKGEIIELGDTNKVLFSPSHDVTRRLVKSYFIN